MEFSPLKTNDDFNKLKDEAFLGNKMNTNKLLATTTMDYEKNILYLNIINQRLEKLLQIHKINKSNIDFDFIKENSLFCPDRTIIKKWENFLKETRKSGSSLFSLTSITMTLFATFT